MRRDFAKQTGNIEFLILSIGAIVFFTLLLVTGNTMAIAVRERTPELAILKALGYSNSFILIYVLAESVSIALIGRNFGIGRGEGGYVVWQSDSERAAAFLFADRTSRIWSDCVALAIGGLAGLIACDYCKPPARG